MALVFGILIVLIAVRFLLLALGANAGNALVDGTYGISEPFVAVSEVCSPSTTCRPSGGA